MFAFSCYLGKTLQTFDTKYRTAGGTLEYREALEKVRGANGKKEEMANQLRNKEDLTEFEGKGLTTLHSLSLFAAICQHSQGQCRGADSPALHLVNGRPLGQPKRNHSPLSLLPSL